METKQQIIDYCRKFRTTGISTNLDALVKEAELNATGFMEFTLRLLGAEAPTATGTMWKEGAKRPGCPAAATWISMTTASIAVSHGLA